MPRALLSVIVLLVACTDPQPDTHADGTADPSDSAAATNAGPASLAALSAVLDSAREAYEAGNPAGALAHYRNAIESDSTLAAAWFGVFITQRALGDTVAADSAFRRSRRLAEAPLGGSAPARR
jgi:hypothetical protein